MIRHSKEWKPNRCSQSNFIQRGFKSYGKCITTAPFKIIIIIVTLGILGVGIYGNILLRQEFDPTWFLPADTYLSKWFTANKKYFPFGKFLHTIMIMLFYFIQFDLMSVKLWSFKFEGIKKIWMVFKEIAIFCELTSGHNFSK